MHTARLRMTVHQVTNLVGWNQQHQVIPKHREVIPAIQTTRVCQGLKTSQTRSLTVSIKMDHMISTSSLPERVPKVKAEWITGLNPKEKARTIQEQSQKVEEGPEATTCHLEQNSLKEKNCANPKVEVKQKMITFWQKVPAGRQKRSLMRQYPSVNVRLELTLPSLTAHKSRSQGEGDGVDIKAKRCHHCVVICAFLAYSPVW